MDQYFDIVAGAVDQIDNPTGPARVEVYNRIRAMFTERVDNPASGLSARQKTAERLKLERAIRRFERGYALASQSALPPTSASTISIEDFDKSFTIQPGLGEAVAARSRVVEALIVRSARLAASRDRSYYFWMVAEPCLQIGFIVLIYWFLGRANALDMPALPFAILGSTSWFMFKNVSNKISLGPGGERLLIYFSTVSRFDIALAQAAMIGLTYLFVGSSLLSLMIYLEQARPPENLLLVLFWFMLIWLNGFGIGLALQPFSVRHVWVKRVYILMTRPLFFFSGILFVSEQLPPEYRAYVIWNPLLHLMQLLRSDYFMEYQSIDANVSYALVFTIVVMLAGLVGERAARFSGAAA